MTKYLNSATSRALAGCAIGLALAGQAFAAGFEVKERSATAQGAANAGATAAAEDVSYMYFNPAAIGYQEGFNVGFGANVIIPNAETNGATGTILEGTLSAAPILGPDGMTDTLGNVPSLYMSAPLSEDWTIGLAITAPFGLVTDYGNDWIGRYHAIKSDLKTINFSPTIGWRPTPWLSIGGGPVIEYADAELTQAVELGATVCAQQLPAACALPGGAQALLGTGALDGKVKLEGDDVALGWTLGVIVEPINGTRLGAAFRSEINHDVTLTSKVGTSGGVAAQGLLAAIQGTNVLTGGNASTSVAAPAQLNLGFSQELGERWKVMGDAQWTQWSSFDALVIDFDDSTPDSVVTTQWDDTWFFSLGAQYHATQDLTLRAGVAYDMEAVQSDEFRGPRIPDSNRIWGAFGASYDVTEHMTITGAYTYVYVEDSTIALDGTAAENVTRGSLDADVEANVHILTLGGTYKF